MIDKSVWRQIAAVLAFATSAPHRGAQSQPNRAGEIRGSASPLTAARNDPVYRQDTVRTDRAGRVRIGLLDGSILNVGSASSLIISKHNPPTQQTQIELEYGRIRPDVVRIVKPGGSFEIRTPGAVTGVVGTKFDISSTADLTMVC
jgi:hypothetical protein